MSVADGPALVKSGIAASTRYRKRLLSCVLDTAELQEFFHAQIEKTFPQGTILYMV
ncbi:MAG: hypothetical protein HPY52_12560 [Firmicutes bacterium]|nr:hypothetical protein [Bacillota bacterium]